MFSAITLGGAFGVILARNPVHSALFLVLTLIAVAGFFLLQDADLVAIVQIIVYASAIVVLFLFVIMLLGVDRRETFEQPNAPAACRPRSVSASAARRRGARARGQALGDRRAVDAWCAERSPADGNVHNLASRLFTDFIWPFEITAALLVIAVVGSVVLARRSRQKPGARRAPTPTRCRPMTITPGYYLTVAAMLFTIGAVGLLIRRNPLVMFMCVELMLNAVNLTFVSFAKALNDVGGQVIVFFTLVVAAAEVAVGLAIIVAIFRRRPGRDRRRRGSAEGLID